MKEDLLRKAVVGAMGVCASVVPFLGGTRVTAAPVYELDAIVVTATRMEESSQRVPAAVSVITSSDIQKSEKRSVPEFLGQETGIFLDPAADGGILLRGFGSSDLLVMVDGQPVNSGWNGTVDWTMIPVETIDKIEVVRGAASSLYGGRAQGGVIAITTKEAAEGVHGQVKWAAGSHQTRNQSYNVSIAKEKWDLGVTYERRKTGGWRGYYIDKRTSKKAEGTPVATDLDMSARGRYILGGRGNKALDTESYSVKVGYNIEDNKKLSYQVTHSDHEYAYNNPFTYIKDGAGNDVFGGVVEVPSGGKIEFYPDDFLGYLGKRVMDIHSVNYNDRDNGIYAHYGYTNAKKDGYRSSGDVTNNAITADELQAWDGPGVESFYPWKSHDFDFHKIWDFEDHSVLAGVGYRKESFDQIRYTLEHWRSRSGMDAYETHGGKGENWAGYLQDKWKVNDDFALYMGVRYDRYTKKDGYSWYAANKKLPERYETYDSGTYTQFSPKVSLEYRLNENTNVYASYGKSFTPPILYQVYRDGGMPKITMEDGSIHVKESGVLANPDLRPERTETYEVGIKKKWGDQSSLRMSFFHAKTKDLVSYWRSGSKPIMYKGILYENGFKQYRNMSQGKKKGVELEYRRSLGEHVNGYVNYTRMEATVEGERDYYVPKHLLHFGVEFTPGKWDILADAEYVSARQEPDDDTGLYYSNDPFFVTNLSVNYAFTPEASAQFAVYNLLNRTFYSQEATSDRSYSFTMRYKF